MPRSTSSPVDKTFFHFGVKLVYASFNTISVPPKRKYKKEKVETEGDAFKIKHKSHQLIGRIGRSGEPFHY
jgi:hypothetical protein